MVVQQQKEQFSARLDSGKKSEDFDNYIFI